MIMSEVELVKELFLKSNHSNVLAAIVTGIILRVIKLLIADFIISLCSCFGFTILFHDLLIRLFTFPRGRFLTTERNEEQ